MITTALHTEVTPRDHSLILLKFCCTSTEQVYNIQDIMIRELKDLLIPFSSRVIDGGHLIAISAAIKDGSNEYIHVHYCYNIIMTVW